MDDWRADLEKSDRAFRTIVWDEIYELVGGGRFHSLESGNDDLDRTGGMDGYQHFQTGIRTIAQRTQFMDDYYKPPTFTIRYRRSTHAITEFQKRGDALNQGFDVPGLVIQAYVRGGALVRVGLAHGKPFYEYVMRHLAKWEVRSVHADQNTFLVVPWKTIAADNAAGEIVPFCSKSGLTVHRTPNDFFAKFSYLSQWERCGRDGYRWI